MIISNNIDNTLTNVTNSLNMGVIADGRMFKLLLNNLYSQPIAAVLRELSCNAIDAHVSVGNPNPFHIQLPTLLDSNFIIRDFGPGLDEEEINRYLNTLFSSSKTTSNDFIGSFGLGSKVAFSLVSSFNIESYKNGIKYTCLWYEKDCGTPTLIVTDRSPTEEPNGLKFIVPLSDPNNTNKYPEAFLKTAKETLFNLPIKPKYFYDINHLDSEYEVEYSFVLFEQYPEYNVSLFASPTQNDKKFLHVNIGGIVYKSSVLLSAETYQYILGYPNKILVVDVPIGELTLPMNREEIENTSQNLSNIAKYWNSDIENSILKAYYDNVIEIIESKDFTYYKLFKYLNLTSADKLSYKIPLRILDKIPKLKVSDVDLSELSPQLSEYRRNLLKDFQYFVPNGYSSSNLYSSLSSNNLIKVNHLDSDFHRVLFNRGSSFIEINCICQFKKLYIIYQHTEKSTPAAYSNYSVKKYFEENNYIVNHSDSSFVLFINVHHDKTIEYLKDFYSAVNAQFNNETIFIDYSNIPKLRKPTTKTTPRISDSFIFGVKYIDFSISDINKHIPSLEKSSLSTFKKSVLTDSNNVIKPFSISNYFNQAINTVILIDNSLLLFNRTELRDLLKKDFESKKIASENVLVVVTASDNKYQKMLNLLSTETGIDTFYKIRTEQDILNLRYSIINKYIDTFLDFDNLKQVAYYYYLYFISIYRSAFKPTYRNNFYLLLKYLENLYKYTDDSVIVLTKEDDEILRQNTDFMFNYFNDVLKFKIIFDQNIEVMSTFVNNSSNCLLNCQKIKNYNFKDNFINNLLTHDILNHNVSMTTTISDDDPMVEIRDKFFNKFNFTK